MPYRTLAVAVLAAATLLPATPAAPAHAAVAVPAVVSLAAHRQHVQHLHHLHVLHLRVLAARRAASTERARVVKAAERYLGQPYVYGALDCSGLTQRAYAVVGVHLPRTTAAQASAGHATSSPQPGDLLVYRVAGIATHVAVVAAVRGRAVTDTIVAPHTGTVVKHQKPYAAYQVRAILT